MTRLQDALDLAGSYGHHGRILHRKIHQLHAGSFGEIAAHAERNQHGVADHLRFSEGIDALFECPNDGKGQAVQFNYLAHRRLLGTVNLQRHLLGDDPDFVVRLGVLEVEEASCENHQVADAQVFGIHTEDGDVTFPATADRYAFVEVDDRRGSGHAGHFLLHRSQIFNGQRVRRSTADALRPPLILCVNQVGADRLNLVEYVLPAGHADGDNQNQRGGADHHAQCGEREAHLVTAESVEGKTENLAESHSRPKSVGHEGSSHSS